MARRNAVVVGLDPRWDQLPAPLRTTDRPHDPAARAAAYEQFCRCVIDVVAPLVPVVKPQLAFFEELGPAGSAALYAVIRYARQQKLLVILDGKRNDIGSTAEAYARGYLGVDSPWAGDALTVSPYLGDDSLQPFVETARAREAGIFVLVKTSNPGSGQLQDQLCAQQPLYARVARHVQHLAQATADASGYGAIGAVVGATYPRQLAELRAQMPQAWLLIPGYGAQGAAASDVAAAFDSQGRGAVINSSRAIIFAHARPEYRDTFGAARWQRAVEAATRQMIAELAAETPAGKLAAGH
jgi:orotidine-5'-phosphate decarboxylase